MNDLKILKKIVNNLIVGTTSLLLMTGGANATSVDNGELVLNLDKTVFNSVGVSRGINTIIEHYFDQANANTLSTTQLITDQVDHVEISGDYSNLIFGINDFHSPLGPIIDDSHQLQGTNFEFSESNPSSGQIGFGGVLRLGSYLAGTTTTSGLGEVAIGDFILTHVDRSESGDADASGWLFTTTTNSLFPLPDGSYFPIWDTTDVTVSTEEGALTVSGTLVWTPEAINRLGTAVPTSVVAGTFSVTAQTYEELSVWILDQMVALKAASWSTVSDRPTRITANARLAQAIHYYQIAAANYRQGKFSIGNKYLKLTMASINAYKSVLERGVSLNKFSEMEVMPLLNAADKINTDIYYLMNNPE